ncbi:hypothetical protein CHCC20335_0603 [Bacillus paralicheniformis]|nr:hypothetical protein CHCC20335_0603 [Bacillus paralicheniformis]
MEAETAGETCSLSWEMSSLRLALFGLLYLKCSNVNNRSSTLQHIQLFCLLLSRVDKNSYKKAEE